jgi:hypothetical protein
LSATPWRKGLAKHFSRLIVGATTKGLIDAGYLSLFRAFAPAYLDLTGVHTVAGDYHEGELAAAMNKTHLVADVVTEWLQRAEGTSYLSDCLLCLPRSLAAEMGMNEFERSHQRWVNHERTG